MLDAGILIGEAGEDGNQVHGGSPKRGDQFRRDRILSQAPNYSFRSIMPIPYAIQGPSIVEYPSRISVRLFPRRRR